MENNKSKNTTISHLMDGNAQKMYNMSTAFCGWDDLEMFTLRSGTDFFLTL